MIDKLELISFQSHAETVLRFHPGINVIIGPSNNGKTAIFRAFGLARYNKPAGDAFVSNWARNEKGKQDTQMDVIVSKEQGDLRRGKGPDFNGYSLNGKEFTALGKSGLPDEVLAFFNLTEVNIQNQADGPFLLGNTPAEKARFLNDIVDMEEIDSYLSAVDSKKRSNNKHMLATLKEINDLSVDLSRFSSLEDAERLVSRLEKVKERKALKKTALGTLSTQVNNLKGFRETVLKYRFLEELEGLLKKLSVIREKISLKKDSLDKLSRQIALIVSYRMILKQGKSIDPLEALIITLENTRKIRKGLEDKLENLRESLSLVQRSRETVKKCTGEIKKLEESLPETCPTCGQPYPKGGN